MASAALAALALLASGCGGSKAPSVANLGTTTTAASSGSPASTGAGSSGSTAPGVGLASAALAYAKCMRSSGVPNFPDPSANGGFQLSAGTDPSSPAFQTTRAKCQKLLPGGGPPAPGSSTHPSVQAMAQMLEVSRCMRRHGIAGFPDPTTSVPSKLGGIGGVVSDRDGVIFLFPATLDMRSPLFLHAAAACGFRLTNH